MSFSRLVLYFEYSRITSSVALPWQRKCIGFYAPMVWTYRSQPSASVQLTLVWAMLLRKWYFNLCLNYLDTTKVRWKPMPLSLLVSWPFIKGYLLWRRPHRSPIKHDVLTQCCVNIGLTSVTLGQHYPELGRCTLTQCCVNIGLRSVTAGQQ